MTLTVSLFMLLVTCFMLGVIIGATGMSTYHRMTGKKG